MIELSTQLDITAPKQVEIKIRDDGEVIWVNVDGICRLRICKIGKLYVEDDRHHSNVGIASMQEWEE